MQMTGFPNGPPIRTFFPLINRITALHAAIGALAALREREISGEGQAIDVSLADTGFTVNEIPITAYPADGTIQQPGSVGAALPCLERPEWLEDPRFAKQAGRGKHTDVL